MPLKEQIKYKKIYKQEKNRNNQVNRYDLLMQKSIQHQNIQVDNELDQLDYEIKGYTANQNCNLLAKEIQKRRNLYNELAQKRQEIKKRIEQSHITHLRQQLIQNKCKLVVILEKKMNYESFVQMDTLKLHGQIIDEYLNKINDKVLNIKYSSQNLSKQIKEQNGIIDQLHENTDSANQAMKN